MKSGAVALSLVALVAVGGLGGRALGASDGPHQSGNAVHHATTSDEKNQDEKGKKDDGPQSQHAQDMVAIAKQHREGMKRWSDCVRTAAKSGSAHPTAGCSKPEPPGWVKHPDQHPGGWPPHGSSDRD